MTTPPDRTAPCVRSVLDTATEPQWIPVIGPPHDDAHIIGFDPVHLHVDWRYMHDQQRAQAIAYDPHAPYDLALTHVVPEGRSESVPLAQALADADIPNETFLKPQPKAFNGEFPPYPDQKPLWMNALWNAYRNARVSADGRCPHRGADLSDLTPDEPGVITCPLHGLRWHTADGTSAPPKPSNEIPSANLNAITSEIEALKLIGPQWDGPDSVAPHHFVIDQTIAWLTGNWIADLGMPNICPTTDGGVSISWEWEAIEHSVDVRPDAASVAWRQYNPRTLETLETELPMNQQGWETILADCWTPQDR